MIIRHTAYSSGYPANETSPTSTSPHTNQRQCKLLQRSSTGEQRGGTRHNDHLIKVRHGRGSSRIRISRARRRRSRQLLRASGDRHLEPLGRGLVALVRDGRPGPRRAVVLDRGAQEDGADGAAGGLQVTALGDSDVGVVAEGLRVRGRGQAELRGAAEGGVGLWSARLVRR